VIPTTGYVLSVAADLDLDEIWEYIGADNLFGVVLAGWLLPDRLSR
jgi:hypothetical protein